MNKKLTLKLQNDVEVKNSFYRAPKVSPHITAHKNSIEVKTIDSSTTITKLEEAILYIIADFKFSPYWLIQQWFETAIRTDTYEVVSSWITTGLVWVEATSMGLFLRPTSFLLDMFHITNQFYVGIPFGLLNHTCSEEQIVFDMLIGNERSELWNIIKDKPLLPPYHPLGLELEEDTGTVAIREDNFKLNRFKPERLKDLEKELELEIKTGNNFTAEFLDFARFPIVSTLEDGTVTTQTPDVLVPIPREKGLPQSLAIEIELSAKTPVKYNQIMKNYKDNIKFGKLFYLCGNDRIKKLVKDAYTSVNGLGTCKMYIVSFAPPAMRMSNFAMTDKMDNSQLIKASLDAATT